MQWGAELNCEYLRIRQIYEKGWVHKYFHSQIYLFNLSSLLTSQLAQHYTTERQTYFGRSAWVWSSRGLKKWDELNSKYFCKCRTLQLLLYFMLESEKPRQMPNSTVTYSSHVHCAFSIQHQVFRHQRLHVLAQAKYLPFKCKFDWVERLCEEWD